MKNKTSVFALIIAIAALGMAVAKQTPQGEAKKETAFERVMKTRTLRCAYIPRAHHLQIDAATGEKSGIDYEVVEEIGKLTHLKIEWVEETGYGAFPEQLNSGKEDALCSTVWTSVARASRVLSTVPAFFTPLYVYVREDDARFDGNLDAVNDEKVTIAVMDGSTMKAIADTSFPKAQQNAAPGLSDDGQIILNVATGKGDVMFADEIMIDDYNKRSSGKKLRKVANVPPVRTYLETYSVGMGEFALRELLNAAMMELRNNGALERILSKYETVPGVLLRVPMPYEAVKKS